MFKFDAKCIDKCEHTKNDNSNEFWKMFDLDKNNIIKLDFE